MVVPGFNTLSEFVEHTGVPMTTARRHLKQGYCLWPRKKDIRDGRKKHPLYKTWDSMIGRCYLSSNKSYVRYGAKGVTVCDRWRENFAHFVEDMGERPPGYTLDRIDPFGNYSPENCRWASKLTQSQNKRKGSNTGEFCITQNKHRRYIVEVKGKYRGSFINIEDAIVVRDHYVDLEYKGYW